MVSTVSIVFPVTVSVPVTIGTTKVAHDAADPFVVKYFPEFPVCEGSASTVAHETFVPSDFKYCPAAEACAGRTAFAAPA